ncbi:NAD(P)H-dependent oxidoreductase [Parapedobacter tibetensis]|uniref:NAD(P)H-dependent oxidoreductase n=1 Tax=Parapedobacter tibetensis TaxID=2972951 RepID=UPI00214DC5A9|nr:NAD(P)H-dependent oxidoreductase [Parapedobacter tibetensis]
MKTLVIITHPNLDKSVVNKYWMEELKNYPESYNVHDLYGVYPDEKIDVEKEKQLVEAHDKIVFQFPIYWWNSPPLLKKWLDEVMIYGWAYGSTSGYKMGNKKIALAISAGGSGKEYSSDGSFGYTLEQYLLPFEISFKYVKADYKSFFPYYGAEGKVTQRLEENTRKYLSFIEAL